MNVAGYSLGRDLHNLCTPPHLNFSNSALTRHKGGRNSACSAETGVPPGFVCDCGKFLMYRGIPTHRNKCSLRIRKIIFGPEEEVDISHNFFLTKLAICSE